MKHIAISTILAAGLGSAAAADIWNPTEFYLALGNPKAGDTQDPGAMWTFRTSAFNGPLMTGFDPTLICEAGFGFWGTVDGAFGFIPNVGPRTSPDEDMDQTSAPYLAEFDGLLVIPSEAHDAYLVFTAPQPVQVPPLTLRAEALYGSGTGVRVSVKTRINGQNKTWLDKALVPIDIEGFQEWHLFDNQAPTLQTGDQLWIEVNPNGTYDGDWTNIALLSIEGCYADFTGDGILDLFDFLDYVNAFNAEDPAADCTGDAILDLFDFLCFVNTFSEGC